MTSPINCRQYCDLQLIHTLTAGQCMCAFMCICMSQWISLRGRKCNNAQDLLCIDAEVRHHNYEFMYIQTSKALQHEFSMERVAFSNYSLPEFLHLAISVSWIIRSFMWIFETGEIVILCTTLDKGKLSDSKWL